MKGRVKFFLIILAVVAIGALVYGLYYYNHNYVEQVNDYYRISIQLPRIVDGTFGKRVKEGEIEIKKLGQYRNDSIVISEETRSMEEFTESLLEKLSKCSDDPKGRIEAEVYEELLDERHILMRISHIRKFDKDLLKKFMRIIKKNGVYSVEARQYIEKNKIDVEFYTIKD